MQLPHNDALVVTLQIDGCNIRRVLVDHISSAKIMYYSLFKELGLPELNLSPSNIPLVGFNSAPVWPIRRITLPVRTRFVIIHTEFTVADVSSPYNAIVGRAWLHGMKAVASTYCQVVRYIGANGRQIDFCGDQVASKKCYVAAVRCNSPNRCIGSRCRTNRYWRISEETRMRNLSRTSSRCLQI